MDTLYCHEITSIECCAAGSWIRMVNLSTSFNYMNIVFSKGMYCYSFLVMILTGTTARKAESLPAIICTVYSVPDISCCSISSEPLKCAFLSADNWILFSRT